MIYVVLGMHKSGTTLVSQLLHNSGVDMVESANNDVSYDEGNKYERQSVLALNMELLGTKSDEVRDLPQPKNLEISAEQQKCMQKVIAECNAKFCDWGLKDPRTTYTYPLWKREMPEHRIIAIYRSPEEIWPRFRRRGLRRRYVNPLWAWQFLSRWMEHNRLILDYVGENTDCHLLLDYREMMQSDIEIQRLERFVNKPIRDARKKALYRARELRTDICLAFAAWLMQHVKRQSANVVMEKLSVLRAKQCAPSEIGDYEGWNR